MALLSDYTAGTVDLTTGTKAVTGTGTAWKTAQFQEGDWFIAGGHVGIVATVADDTSLTLVDNWAGATLSDASYRLRYMSDGSRSSAQARALINLLGTHAFFDPDASGDLAGRDTYDGQKAGFSYLDLDNGEIYFKASDTSADWAGPFSYGQGEKGDAATVTVGTTTTVDPGEDAAVTNSGTSSAAVLDFDIPQGEQGTIAAAKGDYGSETTYATGAVVLDQGSSWVALQETTGNAPPTLPTTANSYWQLIAKAGDNGEMAASVYDPNGVEDDAFSMANMAETAAAKVMTAAERTKLSGIETGADKTDAENVAAAIGYTPANKAGDTFTGNVFFNDGTISHRLALAASGTVFTGTFTNHPVVQQINNAEVARWTSAGLDLKAGGLKFPATAIPSADPNTLDDYEEGTWTPTIAGTTTAGSNTYADQNGIYVKIGSLVLLMGYVRLTAKDAAMAGSFAIIGGLPFTCLNSGTSRWSGLATEMTNITGVSGFGAVQIQQNASFAYIMKNAQAGYVSAADIQNNTQIGFSIAYRTAS